MQWNKVKNIFIIFFAVINIFLFYLVIQSYFPKNISNSMINDSKKALLNYGVKINFEVSRENKEAGNLMVREPKALKTFITGLNKEEIDLNLRNNYLNGKIDFSNVFKAKFLLDEPIKKFNATSARKYLIERLGSDFIPFDKFIQVDKFEKQEQKTYIYHQNYRGIMIIDNYIKTIIKKEGVTIEWRYMEVTEEINKKPVWGLYHVMLKNIDLFKNKEVNSGQLVYKMYVFDDQQKEITLIPVWKIGLSGEKDLFFRASNAEFIKNFGYMVGAGK